MKDIKDYLPFYLGCECQIYGLDDYEDHGIDGIGKLTKVDTIGDDLLCTVEDLPTNYCSEAESEFVKPILRKLSSMTEEEYMEIDLTGDRSIAWFKAKVSAGYSSYLPEEFTRLLSRGFDLFNLIEEGLAIDKDTLRT